MRFVVAAGAAAVTPLPVAWDFLGYSYHPGPVFISAFAVAITRAIVFLQITGRRQVVLDIMVSILCALVAVLWTQANSLDPLPAGITGIGIAAIGIGIIGMAKGQVGAGIRAGLQTTLKAWASTDTTPPPGK